MLGVGSSNFFGFSNGLPAATLDVSTGAVPEPGSVMLLGLGALGIVAARRRAAA